MANSAAPANTPRNRAVIASNGSSMRPSVCAAAIEAWREDKNKSVCRRLGLQQIREVIGPAGVAYEVRETLSSVIVDRAVPIVIVINQQQFNRLRAFLAACDGVAQNFRCVNASIHTGHFHAGSRATAKRRATVDDIGNRAVAA